MLIRPEDVPPGKSTLSGVAEGAGVRLSWGAPATAAGVSGYIVERRRGDESVWKQRTERLTALEFFDERVRPGTDYVYRLVMVDGNAVPWPGLFPETKVHTPP